MRLRFLIATILLLATACVTVRNRDLSRDAQLLRNDDITWDGNWLGLWPSARPGPAERLQHSGGEAVEYLVPLLDDPDRYVAAHVILTWVSRRQFSLSGSEFNHLRVALYADGPVEIPDQRSEIRQLWRDTLTPKRRTNA